MTVQQAIKERKEISQSPEADSSRRYFHDILRYVNITEYLAVVENIRFFLSVCPHSLDTSKNLEFWKYLHGYLSGLRYVDDVLKQKMREETNIVQNLKISDVNSFYQEMNRFCQQIFLPMWLSHWENK